MTVGIYGYDLMAYRKFIRDNPVDVQGIVKLGEVYQNPSDALLDPQTKFWQDGQEIPVEAVPTELLTADKVAVLDADGTLHVMIAPQITGTQEAIDKLSPLVDEVDQFGTTTLGMMTGMIPTTTMGLIGSAVSRINSYTKSLDYNSWERFWASLRGESVDQGVLDQSMRNDFSPERVAELSAYVGEITSAVLQGKQVSETDVQNLQDILTFLQGLDTTQTGTHILEGVGEGMTAAGWDSDAQTVAANLEAALNAALQIHSPSQLVRPIGENVSSGVGQGMSAYDFGTDIAAIAAGIEALLGSELSVDTFFWIGQTAMNSMTTVMKQYSFAGAARTIARNAQSALSSTMNRQTFYSIGVNLMQGLAAGIRDGTSSVVSAMQGAAQAAVQSARDSFQIRSPSHLFRDEVGVMVMRGFGEGVLMETAHQQRVIRNAARYLTEAAQGGVTAATVSNDNRKTYNQNSSFHVTQHIYADRTSYAEQQRQAAKSFRDIARRL